VRKFLAFVLVALLNLQLQAAQASVEPYCCDACPAIGLCVQAAQCAGCTPPLLPSRAPALPPAAALEPATQTGWAVLAITRSLIWRPPQSDSLSATLSLTFWSER
jgi:hypothetical protein